MQDLREILLSTSISESYDSAGRVTETRKAPFLDPWHLEVLDFDPDAGRRRLVATFSSGGRSVTATMDASDFGDLVTKKSRDRAWNGTRYRDLAVHLSVLIEEQIITHDPADLATAHIRIRRPADR